MGQFFLGVAIFGLIFWCSSYAHTEADMKLFDSYRQKKRQGESPSDIESHAYWAIRIKSFGP